MTQPSLEARTALADTLRGLKQQMARAVTEEFFKRHPDWLARYGERGRRLGIEDAGFHIDFLAGAIESGTTAPFADYARWTVRVLGARGIAPAFIVENLQQIGQALGQHLVPADQAVVAEFIQAGCAAAGDGPAPTPGQTAREGLALTQSLFLQALLQGQRKPACTVALEAVRQGHAIPDIYAEVLQPSLYEVGRLWEANRISVAQEHMATAITQYVLAELYARLVPPAATRGNAVITGVEGELHQVGANMVADVLEAEGWNVRFLGTNLPHGGILQAAEDHRADVVGISATMLFNVPRVRHLIADLRQKLPSRPRILVGGGAFRSAPALAREIGADGFAPDLRAAVALLNT